MLAIVRSAALLGVDGLPVTVEVHVSVGLPGFAIVGLPDAACREARDRVRAAVLSSGLKWPSTRITVNLAPSGTRKAGTGLDLAMAVGVLVASEQAPPAATEVGYLGELGLDGAVRPVPGALPMAGAIRAPALVVSDRNGPEVALVRSGQVRTVGSLRELVDCLEGRGVWSEPRRPDPPPDLPVPDLADVRGNLAARRAIEVAAAGGHHLLMVGPPGAGKTMLAERIVGLLEPLGRRAALRVTAAHSAAGQPLPSGGLITRPPFRSPHHTVSQVALVGGGSHTLRPGEITLASEGILFLDELGEFGPAGLDALRQPLESGTVRISRAHANAELPARFQLVAAMNPCPCGRSGFGACTCSDAGLARYRRRVSGPLLDRFDLRVLVHPVASGDLLDSAPGESTDRVAVRVAVARERARARGVRSNREMSSAQVEAEAPLTDDAAALLRTALDDGRLSARGLRRVRAVGLTLADLARVDPPLSVEVVSQALMLRADLAIGGATAGAS